MSQREERERNHEQCLGRYKAAWMIVLFLLCLTGAYKYFEAQHKNEPDDFKLNLSTEILGVIASTGVTLFFLDKLNQRRDRENLKRRLIGEAGSRSNDIAISAVEWMRRERWLKGADGLLQGANLIEANLQDAHLGGANLIKAELGVADLRKANMWNANLRNANLSGAKLRGTSLLMADLQEADLRSAQMQESNLMQANLEEADLRSADLQKASLRLANLQHVKLCEANLEDARFDGAFMREADIIGVDFSGAIMPDGKLAYESGSDVRKFTDPTHPEFSKAIEDVKRVRRELGLWE